MPRGRMLNKSISFDEKVSEMSLKSILLYTWCIPHLDVKGRIYGIPSHLKGVVIPFVEQIKQSEINKLLDEMVDKKLISQYGENNRYLEFTGFKKNQNINEEREAESIIPAQSSFTPDSLQSKSRVTPQEVKLSKDKLSKVNISKELAQTDFSKSVLSLLSNCTKIKISEVHLTKLLPIWEQTYKEQFDICKEIKKAEGWLVAKKRTKSNYGLFLTNWFNRVLDKGEKSGNASNGPQTGLSENVRSIPKPGKYDHLG